MNNTPTQTTTAAADLRPGDKIVFAGTTRLIVEVGRYRHLIRLVLANPLFPRERHFTLQAPERELTRA